MTKGVVDLLSSLKRVWKSKREKLALMHFRFLNILILSLSRRRKRLLFYVCIETKKLVALFFVMIFEFFFYSINTQYQTMVIVGDFNVWAESVNTDSVKLYDLMTSFGLLQLVNDPPHEDGHTLDHYSKFCYSF